MHGMSKLNVNQIRDLAKEIVRESPGGIRYSRLVEQIGSRSPETPRNTIHGAVWDLATRFPDVISKPSRGLFMAVAASSAVPSNQSGASAVVARAAEEDFYEPFANWLRSELDEATVAVALGGAGLRAKWGTPDVVGVYKPLASHRIKFDVEIISAEVKLDAQQPVVAFGQAAAYRLFSSKSYVVMPAAISEEDYGRLEALCMLFGIGLVLYLTPRSRTSRFVSAPSVFRRTCSMSTSSRNVSTKSIRPSSTPCLGRNRLQDTERWLSGRRWECPTACARAGRFRRGRRPR